MIDAACEAGVNAPGRDLPRWVVPGLCVAAAAIAVPFAPYIVLAVWLGLAASYVHQPLCRRFGGRRGLAAVVTLLSLLLLVVPITALIASLVIDAVDLVREAFASDQANTLFERLVSGSSRGHSARSASSRG
ncbi:MAG: hypothetical protein ABI678_18660, partial [Kofleriaceae bacterium]